MRSDHILSYLKKDLPAGLVVFLVALPLCLGIALASGAPLFSGIIAGIIGGIVVGLLSDSHTSVSGPAAGLAAIVLVSIQELTTFEIFLSAVVIAGLIQLIFGFLRLGFISNYFPHNVIEGMLAGIGIIIFMKQIPHAFGYDKDTEGDLDFVEASGNTAIDTLLQSLDHIHPLAIIITMVSLLILLIWEKSSFIKSKLPLIPGPLVAVTIGIIIQYFFSTSTNPNWVLLDNHLVALPILESISEIGTLFTFPDFSAMMRVEVWTIAATIAIVASIESLLSLEAVDRMDPYKRLSSANKELKVQGIGNLISGFIGGLPITSVIIRSSANINAGGRTKMATIVHGILLLVCVLSIPRILNHIPLATLAAILLIIGYKLASPSKIKKMWDEGKYQFVPYIITLLGVVFTDLLKGVALGLIVSIFFILRGSWKNSHQQRKIETPQGKIDQIVLAQEVTFLNKAEIKKLIQSFEEGETVWIDASNSEFIAHDVLDMIREFKEIGFKDKDIKVILTGFKPVFHIENDQAMEYQQ